MEGFRAHPHVVASRPAPGTGSVGREELARRTDDFAHGRFSLLLREGKSRRRIATVHPRRSRHHQAPRQSSPESCGGKSGFPRTTRAGWSKFGSKDADTIKTSCKARGRNSRCDRCLPLSSLSSPNIHWSWMSASSQNVCRTRRQEGPQDLEGAATRCGFRSSRHS